MRNLAGAFGLALISSVSISPSALATGYTAPPQNAPVGCYEQHTVPAQYRTVNVRQLVSPATTRVQVVPARYGYQTRTVLAVPERRETITSPAQYRTVHERVLVRPESTSVQTIPAQYRTEHASQLVSPARTEWQEKHVPGRGPIMCRVEIPAQYTSVSRQVLVSPASSRTIVHPAQYQTVARQVLVSPAQSRMIVHPAQYREVRERIVVQAQTTRHYQVPAQYRNVRRQQQIAPAHSVWRRARGISPDC